MDVVKVLMADDEPEILELMAEKVVRSGYQVITAQDGEEAWEKIQKESPDVILLDLTMPKMDGFTVLQNLREHPPSDKWQPVIIISAKTDLQDIQKGFSLEADHYIAKPCNLEDVVKGIRMMVNLIPQHKSIGELENEKK